MITIVGLGAGEIDQMPLGIYKILKNAKQIYLRTKEHPAVDQLALEGVRFTSFDSIYEQNDTFEEVYEKITSFLIEESAKNQVVYAVPGHPLVAESVVSRLVNMGANIKIVGGRSFLDDIFTSLKIDPIEGFLMLDATSFEKADLSLSCHTIFCQVYNAQTASLVKLPLLEILPYDYEIFIITAAGTNNETIKRVKLFELDHQMELNNLTSVYIPPVPKDLQYKRFSSLKNIVATLRSETGCPWDRAQTHESLKTNLISETEELLTAIDNMDIDNFIEELGDVLLQIMLHCQIADEDGLFNIEDVVLALNEKLIRRHPHVFGDVVATTPEEAMEVWQQMKKKEKGEQK